MSDWLDFLASRGARIEDGRVAGFGDAPLELRAARGGTIVADLSSNALLAVSGDDAAAFLHGQFTNDVTALSPGGAQWSGWCTPKGRLIATFLLLRTPEQYLLMLPASLAESFARRLRMFVLRSRVKIDEASGAYACIGLSGEAAEALAAGLWQQAPAPMEATEKDGGWCIRIDDTRFVIVAPVARAQALWDALSENAVKAGPAAWEATSIRAGIPTVVPATQEAFIPQMVNFELLGGVSFKKGCYPGQEIVARTQYRGKLKRRMVLVRGDGSAPSPGSDIFSPGFGDQSAGTVVNAVAWPDGGFEALVVAQLEAIEQNSLRAGSASGPPLPIEPLPYPIT
jgi:tRNA-modifying protein YgfZ